MRILLLIDWNRWHGGAEAYVTWLRDGLRAAGDEVRLLTSSAGTAGEGMADHVACGTNSRAVQTFLQIANPLAAATVRRALREFSPHVVCVNMFAQQLSPAALLALGTVPKVLLVTDYKLVCPLGSKLLPDRSLCDMRPGWVCRRSGCLSLAHWLRDQPRYALIRSAVGRFCRVLACSRWVQGQLAETGVNAEVILLPVPARSPDLTRLPASDPTFLYCGRLDAEKGADLLMQAFARLRIEFPAAGLRIAGQGPERAKLERLAGSLGVADAVRFLGWLSAGQVEWQMAEAWSVVVPSIWAEPQGLVAAEALIRGVPVIASSAGGLGEMVEHGTSGLLFANNDEEALLGCLRAIASGAAFPAHVLSDDVVRDATARFSLDRHVHRMRRIFAETV
jgi:glycosyltransferase involved in cell wall biosynthesis